MKFAALTGGIGMGKSTVADMFRSLGALTVDSDAIARSYLGIGTQGYERVVARYGSDLLDDRREIRRDRLAERIFKDTAERRWLESVVHPYVYERIGQEIEAAREKEGIMIIEVPLLFETKAEAWLRPVILVVCNRDAQIERIRRRMPGLSEENIIERINAQMPIELKQKSADFIVDNAGDIAHTVGQVKDIWNILLKDGAYEPEGR